MRRVYVYYWLRQLRRPVSRVALVSVLIAGLASTVSIVNVFLNAPFLSGVPAAAQFFVHAFATTSVVVQGMTLALAVCVAWFAFDVLRTILVAVTPAHRTFAQH